MSGALPCSMPRGWPGSSTIGLAWRSCRWASPSENCRRLWLALIGPEDRALPAWQALASQDGGGCEFGWEGQWLSYRFLDGRVGKP